MTNTATAKKPASSRIYLVVGPGNSQHLVQATSQAAAIRAIVANAYTVSVASQTDLVALTRQGIEVQSGTSDTESTPQETPEAA